ncbi:MAG TPA: hypothetical protein VJA19_09690 [Pseudomonas sp.]|nr:hypothetical protein [Pseudomonas sp.]
MPRMTAATPAPALSIQVFPDSIFMVDDQGEVSMIEQPPRTPVARLLRWGWPVTGLLLVGSFFTGPWELSVWLFGLALFYPLLALIVANMIFPATEYQAHFDAEGLHLAIGQGQDPTAEADLFVPYADITTLVTLDHHRDMGRNGTTWFRSYIIKTKEPYGKKPHLQINTKRSVESVYSVLKRVSLQPAARHIRMPPLITIGNPPPTAAQQQAAQARRAQRLRGEV